MKEQIVASPQEIAEIAKIYHSILELEVYLSDDSQTIRRDGKKYLEEVHIPDYKKLPKSIQDALSIDINRLEDICKTIK